MDLEFFRNHDPTPNERWARGVTFLTRQRFASAGVEIEFRDEERLGEQPSLLACNATHQYDLVPIRYAFRSRGHNVVTYSKGKNYHGVVMRAFTTRLGSVPIVSKGYLIAMDFLHTHRRRPSDVEYRTLRDHVDNGCDVDGPADAEALLSRRRSILGAPFEPSTQSYRDAVLGLYETMMASTIQLSQRALHAGHHVQIFPQGSSSTRLSEGRIGAVQLAHALGVPLLPIGVNGCLTVLPKHRSLSLAPGTVELRVGRPFWPDLGDLPADFRPFDPTHEREHRAPLTAATAALMDRINALLDPEYQWADDRESDGASGVARFV